MFHYGSSGRMLIFIIIPEMTMNIFISKEKVVSGGVQGNVGTCF